MSELTRFEFLVDINSYPKARFIAGVFMPNDLPGMVISKRYLDEMYWYFDEKGSADYLALTRYHAYNILTENRDFLLANRKELFDRLFKYYNYEMGKSDGIDYMPLGIGSADKEFVILDELITRCVPSPIKKIKDRQDRYVDYIPVDSSFPLLQDSLGRLFADTFWKFDDRINRKHIIIKPVLADILYLSDCDFGGHKLKLLSSLGMVWNCDIAEVFTALKGILVDLEKKGNKVTILIDAEFIGGRGSEQLKESYDNTKTKRFLYNPLGNLNQIAKNDPDATFKTIRGSQRYYNVFEKFDWNEENISVEIVNNTNFKEFIKKFKFSESHVKKVLLGGGVLESSHTVAIVYTPTNWTGEDWPAPILLGYSTRFDIKEFTDYIVSKDFEIIWAKNNDKETFGYFLLSLAKKGIRDRRPLSSIETPIGIGAINKFFGEKKIKCHHEKTIGLIKFDLIIEKTGWTKRNFFVLIQFSKSRSVNDIRTDYDKLVKNYEIAKHDEKKIKGAVLWVSPKVVSPDMVSKVSLTDNVKIIRNKSEMEKYLNDINF